MHPMSVSHTVSFRQSEVSILYIVIIKQFRLFMKAYYNFGVTDDHLSPKVV